ncbi:HAMP domain-containing sensor histidine kinase [Myxococcaceae bacterium GXIMD 01537]
MSLALRARECASSSFRRWLRAQNAAEVLAASTVGAWVSLLALVTGLLAVAAWAPGARTLFALPFQPALACFVPALAAGLLFAGLHRGRERVEAWGWLLMLVGIACLHFFVAALMALSALPGATVFGAFLLFTVAFHGRLLRATVTQPFPLLGTVLALVAALPLRASQEHLALFGVIAPSALIGGLYLGTFAVRHDQATAEAERLRAAVHAQLLDQQERDVGRLSHALVEILGYNHDINHALMSAGTAADMLAMVGMQRHSLARAEVDELLKRLNESLGHIKDMVMEIRQKGRRHTGGDPEGVELQPVLAAVRASVALRFPDVDLELAAPRGEPLRASVRGGATTLRRVVENLLLNACEGDGVRGARRVHIAARVEPLSGRLEVVITDDGPGFPPESLVSPIEGLYTTKAHGTGLGLYTSECLLRASGGLLERRNGPERGAVLRIVLPREFR